MVTAESSCYTDENSSNEQQGKTVANDERQPTQRSHTAVLPVHNEPSCRAILADHCRKILMSLIMLANEPSQSPTLLFDLRRH